MFSSGSGCWANDGLRHVRQVFRRAGQERGLLRLRRETHLPNLPSLPLWRKPDKEPREIKDMLLTEKYRRRSGVPHGADNRWVLCVFDAWPTPEDCVCGEEENRGTLTDDES